MKRYIEFINENNDTLLDFTGSPFCEDLFDRERLTKERITEFFHPITDEDIKVASNINFDWKSPSSNKILIQKIYFHIPETEMVFKDFEELNSYNKSKELVLETIQSCLDRYLDINGYSIQQISHQTIREKIQLVVTLNKTVEGYEEAEKEFNANPGRLAKSWAEGKAFLVKQGVKEGDIITHPNWKEMLLIPIVLSIPDDDLLDIAEINKETGKFDLYSDWERTLRQYKERVTDV